jgi:hypothetical protein
LPTRNLDGLYSDKLGLELRLAILKKHAHDFLKVALEFVEALALAVGPRPARNMPNEQAGVWVTLDDEVEAPHGYLDLEDTLAAGACSTPRSAEHRG